MSGMFVRIWKPLNFRSDPPILPQNRFNSPLTTCSHTRFDNFCSHPRLQLFVAVGYATCCKQTLIIFRWFTDPCTWLKEKPQSIELMSDSGIGVFSPLFDCSLLRPIIIMLRFFDNGLGKLFSNFKAGNQINYVHKAQVKVVVASGLMPRMRIWDCGELGLSFGLGALKIYQMLNRWFVSSHTTHTQKHNKLFYKCFSFRFCFSVFTQIYNLFKFAIASTFKQRDFCSFLLFCRVFFSPHLFKVIYCRLFTACRLLSPQLLLLLSGQLWNLFQLANFGASATPFTVAVRPVTKQLDTLPQVARQ